MIGKQFLAAIAYSSVLALGISGSAVAEDYSATQQGEPGMAQGGGATRDEAGAPAMDHGLVGMPVRNGQGKELGEVANILATKGGRIDAIILEAGGVLGVGATEYVVPWDRVQIASGQGGQTYVMVDVPADKVEAEFSRFEAAPATGTGTKATDGSPQSQQGIGTQ